jgi:ribosomal protein S18 acetylase RimI-like enzyme
MPIREVRLETFDPELHSQRLRDWLHRPHVARWWGDPQLALENSLRCSPESDLPEDLVDIDVLIGEPEFLDRGVGPRSLGLLLDRLRTDPVVTVAGVGTSVSNERAIRAFEKAGFRLFREFQDPEFGSCWYMVVGVRDAA